MFEDRRDTHGFPFLLTGSNEQAEMPHRKSDLEALQQRREESRIREFSAAIGNSVEHFYGGALAGAYINIVPHEWKSPQQRKLDRAKAIAAEVCARRFPVTKIPKEQQE